MSKYTIDSLSEWSTFKEIECENKSIWVKSRPDNWKHESFINRLKQAVGVLSGKYDVVDWGDQ